MKAMGSTQDLVQEAKVRIVWWALCIFFLTYFLTHASNFMWMNLPVAVFIFCGLRILLNQNESRSKGMPDPRQSHLSYRSRRQSYLNDARVSTSTPPRPSWEKKINNSPVVEAAINDFVDKIIDHYVSSWYSQITPDKEFVELTRGVIMNALGEISLRVKVINIVELIRDIVDLIGDHLESFRRNQAAIGTDVMKKLSSELRDDMLKTHLMASGELYPALLSQDSESKVIREIVDGILPVLLGPQESQCRLVQTLAREILTGLVVQPLVNFASSERINEWIEQLSINLRKVNEQKTPSEDDESHPTDMPPEWMPPDVIELILEQVEKVFQINEGSWLMNSFEVLKPILLLMSDAVDDWFMRKIYCLWNKDKVAHGIRWAQDIVLAKGVDDGEKASDPSEETSQMGDQLGGMKEVTPISLEQQCEALEIRIEKFIFNEAPTFVVKCAWKYLNKTCARDIFYFTQSNVCLKQLAFEILELLLETVFLDGAAARLSDIGENPPHGGSETSE